MIQTLFSECSLRSERSTMLRPVSVGVGLRRTLQNRIDCFKKHEAAPLSSICITQESDLGEGLELPYPG